MPTKLSPPSFEAVEIEAIKMRADVRKGALDVLRVLSRYKGDLSGPILDEVEHVTSLRRRAATRLLNAADCITSGAKES